MAPPPSSIPNYPPPPFFNRNRKLFLASLALTPIGAYLYLKTQQTDSKNDILRIEEEGRKAWAQAGGAVAKDSVGADGRNFGVQVGRSGGGV